MVEVRFIKSSMIETASTGRGISCARADRGEWAYHALEGEWQIACGGVHAAGGEGRRFLRL